MLRPKHCEYNNQDEDNRPNILSDKKYMFILSFITSPLWHANCMDSLDSLTPFSPINHNS